MRFLKKTIAIAASILASSIVSFSIATAEDFSAGSQAKDFGLNDAVQSTFSAKVVDLLCELAGDCADDCGAGNRQLGLVRDADNKLISVLKNGQFSFNGPVEDLLPYCNKKVDVDGIMIGDPEEFGTQFYMLQFIKDEGASEWSKTNQWTKKWDERNPDSAGEGPWFSRDPRVLKQIEATGYFGLGKEADIKYAKENE